MATLTDCLNNAFDRIEYLENKLSELGPKPQKQSRQSAAESTSFARTTSITPGLIQPESQPTDLAEKHQAGYMEPRTTNNAQRLAGSTSNQKATYSSVLKTGTGTTATVTSTNTVPTCSELRQPREMKANSHLGREINSPYNNAARYTNSVAVYLERVPYLPISEVKVLLAAAPIRIQLRHIRNISWIDCRIVELLIDSNHFIQIQNRITGNSAFKVSKSFDPLDPNSFHWENDLRPESKEAVLKNNFIQRLSASIASSSQSTTREHIRDWIERRGLGRQLEKQLKNQGIQLPAKLTTNVVPTSSDIAESSTAASQRNAGEVSRKRRLSFLSSDE